MTVFPIKQSQTIGRQYLESQTYLATRMVRVGLLCDKDVLEYAMILNQQLDGRPLCFADLIGVHARTFWGSTLKQSVIVYLVFVLQICRNDLQTNNNSLKT